MAGGAERLGGDRGSHLDGRRGRDLGGPRARRRDLPRDGGATDLGDGRGDAPDLAERLGGLDVGAGHHHEPAGRHAVVEALEHLGGIVDGLADAEQGDGVDAGPGQRLGRRALEEPDLVVEQAEALEAVADQVEVGLEGG